MNRTPRIKFDRQTQSLIALFGFFIAFPLLEIPVIGISLSFPVFVLICYRVMKKFGGRLFALSTPLDVVMVLFVAMAMLTIPLAPPADRGGFELLVRDAKSFLYLSYWLSVYLFFRRWFEFINLYKLSFYTLVGILVSTAVVLIGTRDGAFFKLGPILIAQNEYAFNTIACLGVGAIYIINRYGFLWLLAFVGLMVYAMLYSDSRTGSILILLQVTGIILVTSLKNRRRVRVTLLYLTGILGVVFAAFSPASGLDNKISRTLGSWIEPFNSDVAALLMDRESALERDKSWLIRRAQVEKGVNLFKEYPFSGVGWGHFRYVRGQIDMLSYEYLHGDYDEYALTRSSHNSYIQVLAETGVLGFVPFFLVIWFVVWRSFKIFGGNALFTFAMPLAVSLIAIAIYFWTISAVTGAVWYFVLGLFAGAVAQKEKA